MVKKANPSLIGLFALSAILLAIAALFYLGEAGLSDQRKVSFILYFDGDVKGLQVGAPVTLRGVKVGQVEEMSISFERQSRQFAIPVIISVDLSRVGFGQDEEMPGRELLDALILQGLRASLNLQSLVTGKMEIQLDFRPDTQVRLMDKAGEYPEIPTTPSNMEKLASALEELPLERMIKRVTEIMDILNKLLVEANLPEFMGDLTAVVQRLDHITRDLEQALPQLTADSRELVHDSLQLVQQLQQQLGPLTREWTGLAVDSRHLVEGMDTKLNHAVKRWDETLAEGESAFEGLQQSADSASQLIRKDSPLQTELLKALRELSAAARSIRIMSEYLERHPEALLRGKN
jgi:paraquat-inducible protein B